MKKVLLLIVLCVFSFAQIKANKILIDSLETQIKTETTDSVKIKMLIELCWSYRKVDLEKAKEYGLEAITECKKVLSEKSNRKIKQVCNKYLAKAHLRLGVIYKNMGNYEEAEKHYQESFIINEEAGDLLEAAKADYNIGVLYYMRGKYDQALVYQKKTLKLRKEAGDSALVSVSYDVIGTIYREKGVYNKALINYFGALKIREQISLEDSNNVRNKSRLGNSYNNISLIYHEQKEYNKALDYDFKALKIREEMGDKFSMASSYNNIGLIYKETKNYKKAIDYFMKAENLYAEVGNKYYMGVTYNNIGMIYDINESYDTALINYNKSLELYRQINYKNGETGALINLGIASSKLGRYDAAISYCKQGLKLAKELKILAWEKNAYNSLALAYEKSNNIPKAYEYYKKYNVVKDTIFSRDKTKSLGKLEGRHELEMENTKKAYAEKEIARIAEEKEKRGNNLQYLGIFVALIFLMIGVLFSGKFTVSARVAEASIFFTVILLFEFIMILLDPTIDLYSEGMPVIKLAANALLALMIFPVHSWLEEGLKRNIRRKERIMENIRATAK